MPLMLPAFMRWKYCPIGSRKQIELCCCVGRGGSQQRCWSGRNLCAMSAKTTSCRTCRQHSTGPEKSILNSEVWGRKWLETSRQLHSSGKLLLDFSTINYEGCLHE